MQERTAIAIIGFGFSGLMTLRHLVAQADTAYELHVFDEQRMWASGLAYSTRDPQHLLNVRASGMGAFADHPNDFFRWLGENAARWRELHGDLAEAEYTADSFVPRMVYGLYLQDIHTASREIAARNGHRITFHDARVRDVTPEMRVVTDEGMVQVARVILATGHFGARELPVDEVFRQHSALLHTPWIPAVAKAFALHYASRDWREGSHIAILGTGLTAVDMIHTLARRGFPGKVTALSRNGQLPAVHTPVHPLPLSDEEAASWPQTAEGLYEKLASGVEAHGEDWRAFIDGLRSQTNGLWSRLPDAEKQHFLQRHMSWWGVRRHRMSADSYALLERRMASGRLTLLADGLVRIALQGDGFLLELASGDTLRADAVINATGFDYRLDHAQESLPAQLHRQGMVTPSATGSGLASDGSYRLSERLYGIGPLLFGERLESTAVPELRRQAQEVAEVLRMDVLNENAPA